jgi:transposase
VASQKAVLEESLMAIAAQVPAWRMYPAVQALMYLRGSQLTAAAILVSELGDVRRFAHPRRLMGYLGLVPKETANATSSAPSPRPATPTPAGSRSKRYNTASSRQKFPRSSRCASKAKLYRDLALKTQVRLFKRGRHLLTRGLTKGMLGA